ncbi:hypothetical protein D9615_006274 [Tricholomella constricta]|uniref:Transmembrane protein n=1 Tax=Tricholomella constricta TaxID=117010 RepID=A0A8H5HB24_9AGAR|nr:hypothetical protein D9615_006274 [Tricholomella constricta]
MFRKVFASLITLIRPPVFLLPPSSSLLLPFFRLNSLIAVVLTALYILLANFPLVPHGRFALSTNPNPPTASSFYQSPASRTVAFAPAQSEFVFGYKVVSSIVVVGAAIAAAILIITKRSNTSPDGEGAGLGNGANGVL